MAEDKKKAERELTAEEARAKEIAERPDASLGLDGGPVTPNNPPARSQPPTSRPHD